MRLPLSGAPWLTNLPPEWPVKPIAALFIERNERNNCIGPKQLLSLSYGSVIRKDIDANDGLRPESYGTYQQIEADNIVLRLIDLQNDKRSIRVGQALEQGIITSAYVALDTDAWACPRYAFYLLLVLDQLKVFYGLGSGMRQSITFSDLGRVPVAVPSRDEQSAIASYLDAETKRIDGLIEEKEALVGTLREMRRSSVTEAITRGTKPNRRMRSSGLSWVAVLPDGWETIPLKRFTRVTGGHTPSTGNPGYWDGSVPWFSPKDMKSDELADSIDHVTELAVQESALQLVEPGTTMIVVRGMILAHTFPVCVSNVEATINQDMKALVPDETVHLKFLPWLLRGAAPLLLSLTEQSAHGTLALRTDRFMSEPLPIPPLDEQLEIVERLEAERARIDELVEQVKAELALLRELRSATITDAVLGRIDVRPT